MRSRVCLVAAFVAIGLLAGCAEERPPINRVQPNALPKSFFVGKDLKDSKDDPEFYSRAQMIDVGYGASQDGLFTSSWGTAEMTRVKFVIQENLLVARLAYERIAGSDYKGVGAESNDGTIVAMYPIESHFDIKREYNSSTGEELNVIGENTSDRPWYEREYIRVDFSKNLNVDSYDFDTLSLIGMFGGVEYEPIAYYVNDPNSEDAPHFDEATGYFDVTNKAFARPQMLDLSYLGWGIDTFPACFLDADVGGGSAPSASCSPVELTVRQAFRRVTNTDFEPKEWDGQRFQAFGGFYKDRYGFSRLHGMSDDKWHRLLSHYNVYQRNHYYTDPVKMEGAVQCYVPATTPVGGDPHRDENKDGTEDECAAVTTALGVGGSRCDTFNQKCTLPLRKRELKPVVWYVSTGSNPEAYEGTDWATQDWDVALRAAIQAGRYAECIAASGSQLTCRTAFESCKAAAEADKTSATPKKQPGAACAAADECVTGGCACPAGKPDCGTATVCSACEDSFDACAAPVATQCASEYPVFKGQMDDIQEAVRLAQEVDDCRRGLAAYASDRAADKTCGNLADRLGAERGLDAGVIAVVKMQEMIVLCHSPVEQGDHELCAEKPEQRLPADLTAEACFNARLNKDTATLARCNAALNVRMGDLRYHMVNNLWAPQDPSSWGIMLDSNDPLTGETVSASINVWTHVTDTWSQGVVDLARLIKGEITPQEVTDGLYVKQWAQVSETGGIGGGSQVASSGQGGAVPGFTAEQLAQTTRAASSNLGAERVNAERNARFTADVRRKFDRKLREVAGKIRFDAQASATSAPYYEQTRKTFAGTPVEAALTTEAMKQYAGVKADKVDTGTMTTLASPFRGASPALQREIRQRKELALAQRGACVLNEAPAPLDSASLADALEEKFGQFNRDDSLSTQFRRAEKMRKYIAAKAQHSVIVHEMGHSMGLRHNFVSSADAYLFRPQYWQLRTKDGTVDKLCVQNCITHADCKKPLDPRNETCSGNNPCIFPADKCMAMAGYAGNICVEVGSEGDPDVPRQTLVTEADAENCVGPRYFDPTTETERKNLIWMFQQSSIMDYAGETTQDFIGLGVYDFAAARLFYGNAVAVLAEPQYRFNSSDARGSAKARSLLGHTDNFGGIVGIRWDEYESSEFGRFFHYSQLQKQMNVISDCAPVDDVTKYKPARWDSEKYGKWSPLLDGLFVAPAGDGQYTRCKTPKVEYVPWNSLRLPDGKMVDDSWETAFGDYYRGGPAVDPQGRVRVPYGFATDRWADLGNLSVYRHDNGADAYELFDFLITQQETQHIFTNYRRGRQSFSVRVAADRALWRYNEKMRDGAKGLGLLANIYRDLGLEIGYPFPDLWPDVAEYQFRDVLLASSIAFDFFTRLADRPASGLHHNHRRLTDGVARSSLDTASNPPMTIVGIPDGAYGIGAGARTGANGSWMNVGFGGRLLENRLAPDSRGEYSSEYTMNCGSYYDKAWTAMLLTESVDNFISDSRRDFVDPRYRSVSMADLFPEGYRRWLANNLTNDDAIKGPRVFAPSNRPVVELPESPTGLSKICASDADCGTGNKCCKNSKMASVSDENRMPGYDKGMCVAGTVCPQSCGFERTYVSDPEEDAACPAGLSCCQGLCSAGSCFVDPSRGIGWTSWLPATGPTTCFWDERGLKQTSSPGQQMCSGSPLPSNEVCTGGLDEDGDKLIDCADPSCLSSAACTVALDPQVGWEQQKFLIAMTMQYLPENQMRNWIDMMTIWEVGLDSDPRTKNAAGEIDQSFLELHDPQGRVYLAKRYGTEDIFGKNVERGVAARVIEHANELLKQAYDCEDGPDHDGNGKPDWYLPRMVNGQPLVRCDWENQPGMCECDGSAACVEFQRYVSVPAFMRQVMTTYRQGNPGMKGIY